MPTNILNAFVIPASYCAAAVACHFEGKIAENLGKLKLMINHSSWEYPVFNQILADIYIYIYIIYIYYSIGFYPLASTFVILCSFQS